MSATTPAVPVIHAVTTDDILCRPDFVERARSVMAVLGARGAIQLRAPQTGAWTISSVARALAPAQSATGAWLIITERLDVALATGARGVQLTQRSIGLLDARRIAPDLAIGASIHSLDEGIAAGENGARWGVITRATAFPVGNAPGEPKPALLPVLVVRTTLPILVIGGVHPGDVAPLRAQGAYGVAAIRGIWDAEHADRAAAEYLSAYEAVPGIGTAKGRS